MKLYITIKNNAAIHRDYENTVETSLHFQEGSDYLTNEARLFITTQTLIHVQNYFNELYVYQNREEALKKLSQIHSNSYVTEDFSRAVRQSERLVDRELYALKLIFELKNYNSASLNYTAAQIMEGFELNPEDKNLTNEQKIELARSIMFSSEYINRKSEIINSTRMATEDILNKIILKREANLRLIRFFTILCVLVVILIFIITILFLIFSNLYVVMPIRSFIHKINSDEKLSEGGSSEFTFLAQTYNSIYDKHKADEILLRQKAEHDELTGILNRSAFAQLTSALTNQKQNLVMLFIDVDYFKQINDQYGHSTGDKVLKRVAQLLSENFRSIDFVSRIGGDEFAVIATDTDIKSKSIIARKLESIQEILANPTNNLPKIFLSIGVAFSTNGYSQELYNKADAALYKTKENGRNGYSIDLEVVN